MHHTHMDIVLTKCQILQRWPEEVNVVTWNAWVVMNSPKPAISLYLPGKQWGFNAINITVPIENSLAE